MHNLPSPKQSTLKSTVKTISNSVFCFINGVLTPMSVAKDYDSK